MIPPTIYIYRNIAVLPTSLDALYIYRASQLPGRIAIRSIQISFGLQTPARSAALFNTLRHLFHILFAVYCMQHVWIRITPFSKQPEKSARVTEVKISGRPVGTTSGATFCSTVLMGSSWGHRWNLLKFFQRRKYPEAFKTDPPSKRVTLLQEQRNAECTYQTVLQVIVAWNWCWPP